MKDTAGGLQMCLIGLIIELLYEPYIRLNGAHYLANHSTPSSITKLSRTSGLGRHDGPQYLGLLCCLHRPRVPMCTLTHF